MITRYIFKLDICTSKASSDGTNNVKGGPLCNSSTNVELSINFANFIEPIRRVVSMRFINGFTERNITEV